MRGNFTTNTKNTSAYMEELQNEFNKMPKGVFNMTRRKIFDLSPYAIVPFVIKLFQPSQQSLLLTR